MAILNTKIDNSSEYPRIQIVREDNSDITYIDSSPQGINKDLEDEIIQREQADNILTTNLNKEINDRILVVNNEASIRSTADNNLQNNINIEAGIRESKDNEIEENLTEEISNRSIGDANLQSNINTEIEARIISDNEIKDILNNETIARNSRDSELQNSINTLGDSFEEEYRIKTVSNHLSSNGISLVHNNDNKTIGLSVSTSAVGENETNVTTAGDVYNFTYSKDVINSLHENLENKITGVFHFKGTLATISLLPNNGNQEGDIYFINEANSEWAWNGSQWVELGSIHDMSAYRVKNIDSSISHGINLTLTNNIVGVNVDSGSITVNENKFITGDTINNAINNINSNFNSTINSINTNLTNHTSNKNNPHNVTKSQIGLGNVDNTSDANKPISTATQNALDSINNAIDNIQTSLGDFTNSIASSNKLGLVKSATTGTTANRNYNVEVNQNNGTMKVNVPWTDTFNNSYISGTTTYKSWVNNIKEWVNSLKERVLYQSSTDSIKFTTPIYTETAISAMDSNNSVNNLGGLFDETSLWQILENEDSTKQINSSHLTNTLNTYALKSYVNNAINNLNIGNYVTNSSLNNTLSNYRELTDNMFFTENGSFNIIGNRNLFEALEDKIDIFSLNTYFHHHTEFLGSSDFQYITVEHDIFAKGAVSALLDNRLSSNVASLDSSALWDILRNESNDIIHTSHIPQLPASKIIGLSSTYYNKTEIDSKISGMFHFKGTKSSYGNLPTNNVSGDVWIVGDKEYAWNGNEWIELGYTTDLSAYKVKDVNTIADNGVSLTLDSNGKVGVNVLIDYIGSNREGVISGSVVYNYLQSNYLPLIGGTISGSLTVNNGINTNTLTATNWISALGANPEASVLNITTSESNVDLQAVWSSLTNLSNPVVDNNTKIAKSHIPVLNVSDISGLENRLLTIYDNEDIKKANITNTPCSLFWDTENEYAGIEGSDGAFIGVKGTTPVYTVYGEEYNLIYGKDYYDPNEDDYKRVLYIGNEDIQNKSQIVAHDYIIDLVTDNGVVYTFDENGLKQRYNNVYNYYYLNEHNIKNIFQNSNSSNIINFGNSTLKLGTLQASDLQIDNVVTVDLHVDNDLEVENNLNIGSDCHIEKCLTVVGDSSFADIETDFIIATGLAVEGDSHIEGNLSITGALSSNGTTIEAGNSNPNSSSNTSSHILEVSILEDHNNLTDSQLINYGITQEAISKIMNGEITHIKNSIGDNDFYILPIVQVLSTTGRILILAGFDFSTSYGDYCYLKIEKSNGKWFLERNES